MTKPICPPTGLLPSFERLRVWRGAAFGSFDLKGRGGRTVATVWSATKHPSEEQARANAAALAQAIPALQALRAIVDAAERPGSRMEFGTKGDKWVDYSEVPEALLKAARKVLRDAQT